MMTHWKLPLVTAAALLLSFSQQDCSNEKRTLINKVEASNLDVTITTGSLLQHIKKLSSDEFEGRAPGTRGETLTVEYLTQQFKKLGLSPGNPNGTYVQDVPMAAIKGRPAVSLNIGKRSRRLNYPDEYVAVSLLEKEQVTIEKSELIFVGYGIVAPEYQWDDYKGVDVKGKTLVMLINDPPVPDPSDPSKLDNKVFEGKTMTYYGRWSYKFEEAARKGAAAAIIVHETGPAGYPYGVLVRSWGKEKFTIDKNGSTANRVGVEAWITRKTALELFSSAGKDFEKMKKKAGTRSFRPVPLGADASFFIKNSIRKVRSQNVVARLPGADPKLGNECVIYSAHWDHLGKNSRLKGDQIYNGALDNASGTAGLLEIAGEYAGLPRRPSRTILFVAFTAEEEGLLGAEYYVQDPLFPLARTLADLNMDCLNPWGRTRDIVVIGLNASPLHQLARQVAQSQGRRIVPDLEPEKGFLYRSDQFAFVKQGVPALYTDAGIDLVGKPAEYGRRKRGEYATRDYHKVTDEVKPDWDLSGAVEDLQFLFKVGQTLADH